MQMPHPLKLLGDASGFQAPSAIEEVEDVFFTFPAGFEAVGDLGRYNYRHDEPTITLFTSAIKQTAVKLNSPQDDVAYLARLQFYAQALHHMGFNEKIDFPAGASRGSRLATALVEAQKFPRDAKGFANKQMAQLLSYAALLHFAKTAAGVPELKAAFRLRNCFVDLMHRFQSPDYKILDLLDADAARILDLFTRVKVFGASFEDGRAKLKG